MQISVGIDIAKEIHWITAIDANGGVLIDHKLENIPAAIAELIEELTQLKGNVRIGLDVVGGIAGLTEADAGRSRLCAGPCAGLGRQPRPPGHRRR